MKFSVVDDDGKGKVDFIGEYEASTGQIMGSRALTLVADLTK